MITKETFIAAAKSIKDARPRKENLRERTIRFAIAQDLAFVFKENNPNFNYIKFMDACDLTYDLALNHPSCL
jgi:hypothetical protein